MLDQCCLTADTVSTSTIISD